MNQLKYKLLTITFWATLFLFCTPVSAYTMTGQCGENATYSFNTSTGSLVISGTGAIEANSFINDQVVDDYGQVESKIKTVTIKNGISKIGYSAFKDCVYLKSVTIPKSVTSIGSEAFEDTGLTSVALPSKLKTIGSYAFYYTKLTTVTIPSSVESIGQCAFQIRTLKTAYIKTKTVKIDKYAFAGWRYVSESNANLMIYGYKNSTAQKYALKYKNGFRTFGVKVPGAPQIKSLSKNKTPAKTCLSFKKVSGAYKYEIQICSSKSFGTSDKTIARAFTTSTKCYLKGISDWLTSKTIYVRVRAYKKVKGNLVTTNWSKTKSTKIK